jgi:hypothetical protein
MIFNRRFITIGAVGLALVAALSATAVIAGQQTGVDERLRAAFARAEALRSVDPEQAYLPLSQVIVTLQPAAEAGTVSAEGRMLLIRSLTYRAEINLEMDERSSADTDLETLLALYPGVSIESFRLSDAVMERFRRAQSRHVGYLDVSVMPPDARVRVDGEEIELGTPQGHPVAAGTHFVEVTLPGFTHATEEVEVEAGRSRQISFTLHRISAVLKLMTRPPGATVVVDGNIVGQTSGTAAATFRPTGDLSGIPRAEFSGELVVEGLMPGEHELEIFMEGYRGFHSRVPIPDLGDFDVGVISLQPSEGMLLLRDLPPDAEVWVDERRVQPEPPARGQAPGTDDAALDSTAYRLSLAPGQHVLTVDQGTAGVFEAEVSVAEQSNQMLTIRLHPGLTFLGVLGGDEMSANAFETALSETFGDLDGWTLLNRGEQGPRLVEGAGASIERLRELANASSPHGGAINWRQLQAATSRVLPGSVFMLVVLSSDDVAESADLWLWPAAPGPARPERVRVPLTGREGISAIIRRLAAAYPLSRNYLGAQFVDSPAATAPVVAVVSPGGPAEIAGFEVGDEILSLAGNTVGTVANTLSWLETFAPNSSVGVRLRGPAGERTAQVLVASRPQVIPPNDPERAYALVWALSAAAIGRLDSEVPTWVLQLNQAAALLHFGEWEAAVELLESIQAPEGAGLSSAMVDYWLGIGLAELGRVEEARAAFERVLLVPEARYLHDEGALLTPRARARIAGLH